jgi:phosphate acetyltransferase
LARNLYITATEPYSGKSTISLGLLQLFQDHGDKIGYIKPIGQRFHRGLEQDEDIELVRRVFGLDLDAKLLSPVPIDEARDYIARGRPEDLMERILEAYRKVAKGRDIVLVEGTDYQGTMTAFEFDINAQISKTLDAPVILVASGKGLTPEEIRSNCAASKESFDEQGCDVLGVVINRVEEDRIHAVDTALHDWLKAEKLNLFGIMPRNKVLGMPRMGEIAVKIGARCIFGAEYLDNLAGEPAVAAMLIGNALPHLKEGHLIITPGDRDDIVLGMMISRVAATYPNIAGILVTGGLEPSDSVKKLIGGLSGFHIPILAAKETTYDVALKVRDMPVSLFSTDKQKLDLVNFLIRRHFDHEKLFEIIRMKKGRKRTPVVFLHDIMEQARAARKRIILPEGDEPRTLKAAERILERGIAELVLLGNPDEIRHQAALVGADISKTEIVSPTESNHFQEFVETYAELRKHKNVTEIMARDTIADPIYFGTMMVHKDLGDGLVSGAQHTTAHTIRPAFQIIKTKPGISIVSSVFLMCLPERVLVYGDCAVNPDPTSEELADIAVSSADTAASLSIEPVIAMLSYSTGASAEGPMVAKVREATKLAKEKRPDLLIEGPMQYDAAISPETGKAKMPGSKVAGKATVFIFPDLDAGNTAYKAVQRSAKVVAVGPILQGLRKPVNDLSRGCLVEDIIYTIAITALQAQQNGATIRTRELESDKAGVV